ncbi:MAG: hypothetical protein ACYTFW_00290 [Planctomycetota bacterium]|jgi:hypothetical protein
MTTDAPPPAEAITPAPEDIVKQQVETEGPPDEAMPVAKPYTEAQLAAAEEEIKMLTPEQWIEITSYIHTMEDIERLGEAPGIAWTNLFGASGGKINITARAMTPQIAADNLFAAVLHVMNTQKHMGWTPSAKSAPNTVTAVAQPPPSDLPPAAQPSPAPPAGAQEPTYEPVEGSATEKFTVATVSRQVSRGGKDYVLVKTVEPAFGSFGVNAWEEVVPVDFKGWAEKQEFKPPPTMAFCYVNTQNKPKKVTQFAAE